MEGCGAVLLLDILLCQDKIQSFSEGAFALQCWRIVAAVLQVVLWLRKRGKREKTSYLNILLPVMCTDEN